MGIFQIIPMMFVIFYLVILLVVFYLIYTWVNKFISLKQEQNDLLREIVRKMDHR